jgi:hypothetical protein
MLAVPAFATQTFTGRFQYEDREFDLSGFTGRLTPRPIRFADVRIVAGNTTLASGATREDGTFAIQAPDSSASLLRAICITSSTNTPGLLVDVRVANDNLSFGDYYSVASAPQNGAGTGVTDFGTTLASATNDTGKAFNIWDVANDAMQYVASPEANGSLPSAKLTLIWRYYHQYTGAFFTNSTAGRYIFLGAAAAYDDTIISHEIGHFIDDLYFRSDSPGGTHYLGDNNQDIRLSWGEGLATYLGCLIRKFKRYDHPEIYVNTDGSVLSFSYEIETLTGNALISSKTGSTNEIAVTAALWDIIDGPDTRDETFGEDDDPLQRPSSEIWKVLSRYLPDVVRPGISIENFWDGWFSGLINNGFKPEMQTVFASVNGIEFLRDAQELDDSAGSAPASIAVRTPPPGVGPKVVISELEMGSVDAIELYNAGDQEIDLSGWTVESSAPGYTTALFSIPTFKLSAGAFVVLTEASGINTNSTLFFGRNIPWSNGNPGACILRDNKQKPVDFVRWGGSSAAIPDGTAFAGPDPEAPGPGKTLGRLFAETDNDSGRDWSAQNSTFGTFNLSGQEKHHTYYPENDVDFVAFNAIAGKSYLIETLNLSNGADTSIDLLDPNGSTILTSNDDSENSKASRLQWKAPSSGNYLIRSRRFDGVANLARYGSYDLRLMEIPSTWQLPTRSLLTVSKPGLGGKYQSLFTAIDAAVSGDTIQVMDNAVYLESLIISGKSITLRAAPGKNPVLVPGGYAPAIYIENAKSVRIEGINISGGPQGIVLYGGSATIVNSVISDMLDLQGYSDAIEVIGANSEVDLINCTIANNDRLGVGIWEQGTVKAVNSIFTSNAAGDIVADDNSQNVSIAYSLISSALFAGRYGNITGNPQFMDPANGNYRLQPTSPAIDRGLLSMPDLPDTDADGLPRAIAGTANGIALPDLGAYEYLPPVLLTSTAVFPQFATGGKQPAYRTTLIVVNSSAAPAVATISLTGSNGEPVPVTISNDPEALDPDTQPEAPRNAYNLSIAPMGAVKIDSAGVDSLAVGYAKVLSSVPLSGTALIKIYRGATIQTEAGASLSKPAKNLVAYIDNKNSASTGYAIANPGISQAQVTLTLRDSSGVRLESKSIVIDPGNHIAEFTSQRFPNSAVAGFEGSLELISDQSVAAVALRLDNPGLDVMSNFPLLTDEMSTSLVFPLVTDGGGYRSAFLLMNPSDKDTTVKLNFFAEGGTPLYLSIGGTLRTSYEVFIKARGTASIVTDGDSADVRAGWVRATSTAPVWGSLVLNAVANGRILSEAAVTPSLPALHLAVYAETAWNVASGFAVCNPNPGSAEITANLRDAAGKIVATSDVILPPYGRVAGFLSGPNQWFSAADQFQGTLEIISSRPVNGAMVRYDNYEGNVFTTIPVIPLQ